MSKVIAVVAHTQLSRAIGKQGHLPWGDMMLKKDLKFFKTITTEVSLKKLVDRDGSETLKRNAVIMGRKTWDSIPEAYRPLSGRVNVVLSRNLKQAPHPEVLLRSDLRSCIEELKRDHLIENIFVVGGSDIYTIALQEDLLDVVFATIVEAEFEGCDAFFPQVSDERFEASEAVCFMQNVNLDEGSSIKYTFTKRVRKETTPRKKRLRLEEENAPPTSIVVGSQNVEETQYLDIVREILDSGLVKGDRTGTGTKSVFGRTMRFSLRNDTMPLLTTKRTFWKGVALELLWFISGDTNAKTLQKQGITIWDGNSSRAYLDSIGLHDREEGDLGPVYGFQWRHFGAEYKTMHDSYEGQGVDQLMEVVNQIKTNPNSRRIIISAWNPAALSKMALPPCHVLCQFCVSDNELSCLMYQRSADMGLGVPFNIASYALLTHLIAKCCGLKPGEFVHVIGDCHVYLNHENALREQLEREPRAFPKLKINTQNTELDKFKFQDLELVGYNPHKAIKMDMAV